MDLAVEKISSSKVSSLKDSLSESSSGSDGFSFSIFTGFSDGKLEKEFTKPYYQNRVSIFILSIIIIFYEAMFFVTIFFQRIIPLTQDIQTELSTNPSFSTLTFLEMIISDDKRRSTSYFLFTIIIGFIFAFTMLIISLYLFVTKRKYTFRYRLFFELCYVILFIMRASSMKVAIPELFDFSPLCTSFFQYSFFSFFGFPFYLIIWFQVAFSLILASIYIVLTNMYLHSDAKIYIIDMSTYTILWVIMLIIKYYNEKAVRKNFVMKKKNENALRNLKELIGRINHTTKTIIPLKIFQNKAFEYYQCCNGVGGNVRSSNSYLMSSKCFRYKRTVFLQADLVDFTRFCSSNKVNNPIKLANLLNFIFTTFDNIINRTPFVVISVVGDAYCIMYQQNILLQNEEDSDHHFDNNLQRNFKTSVQKADELLFSEGKYCKLIELCVEIGRKMLALTKERYPLGLRIGLCIERCYAHIFSVKKRFRFDVYGRGIKLVDYLQKLSPIGKLIICYNSKEALKYSLLNLQKFEEDNMNYVKSFSCPVFYNKKNSYVVKKGTREICIEHKNIIGNETKISNENMMAEKEKGKKNQIKIETKKSMVQNKNIDFQDLCNIFKQDNTSESYISTLYSKTINKSHKYTITNNINLILQYISDIFRLYKFQIEKEIFFKKYKQNNNSNKEISMDFEEKEIENLHKSNPSIIKLCLLYIKNMAYTKFIQSYAISICAFFIMILSPFIYVIRYPYHVKGEDSLNENAPYLLIVYVIIVIIFLIVIIMNVIIYIFHYKIIKKKQNESTWGIVYKSNKHSNIFVFVFFISEFIKEICLILSIVCFELMGSKIRIFFVNYHAFIIIVFFHLFPTFSLFKEISIICSIFMSFIFILFYIYEYITFEYPLNIPITTLFSKLFIRLLFLIGYYFVNEIYSRSYGNLFMGKLKINSLKKMVIVRKEYSNFLLKKILPTQHIVKQYLKFKNKNKVYARRCVGPVTRIEVYPLSKNGKKEINWEREPNLMEHINDLYLIFDYIIRDFQLFRVKCFENYYFFIHKGKKISNAFELAVLFSTIAKIKANQRKFEVSIGISMGAYVRGMPGGQFIQYDCYGNNVNTASRFSHVNNSKGNIQTEIEEARKLLGKVDYLRNYYDYCDMLYEIQNVEIEEIFKGIETVETCYIKCLLKEEHIYDRLKMIFQ